jgi:hypothetical protein
MLNRRNITLLSFALGFAVLFIGVWFLATLPNISTRGFLIWLFLPWAVGSIITSQGLLVCLLSRVELRTALPVIAAHSVLVIATAIFIFCLFVFDRYLPSYPTLRLSSFELATVGLSFAFLYSLFRLSRLPFYRSCTSGWHLWKYFILFGLSLGSVIFFGMMLIFLPFLSFG